MEKYDTTKVYYLYQVRESYILEAYSGTSIGNKNVFSISTFTTLVIIYLLVNGQRYRYKYLISITFQNKSIYRDIQFFLSRHTRALQTSIEISKK